METARLPIGRASLPPANEVCKDYVFTGVCLSTGGGGAAWYRGVHGRGVCISPARMLPRQILGDTVNELAVRILLECILVMNKFEHEGGSLLVYNEVPYLGGRARGQYTVRSHVCGIGY